MRGNLDHRLARLEQNVPDVMPVIVWLRHGMDAVDVMANARLSYSGRSISLVSWLPPQQPQYQPLKGRPSA